MCSASRLDLYCAAMTARVLLADDHKLVRAGIRALLAEIPSVQVVAEASDGREALELVRTHHPDLVLMDISMQGLNGIEATAQLRRELPEVRVIILSMHTSVEHVAQALQAGACGYMQKDSAAQELAVAVGAVLKGETYLGPAISREAVQTYLQRSGTEADPLHLLSPRQREILQLIAEGKGTKEIAYILGVSGKTVETHRAQIMERLKIRDVPGLVRYAVRVGLVTPDQ